MSKRDNQTGRRVGGWVASVVGWLLIGVAVVFGASLLSPAASNDVETDSTTAYVILICGPLGAGWWLLRVGKRKRTGMSVGSERAAREGNGGTGRKIWAALVGLAGLLGITMFLASIASWIGAALALDQDSPPNAPLIATVSILVAIVPLLGFPYLLVSALFPAQSKKNLAKGTSGGFARWFESTAVTLSRNEQMLWMLYVGYVVALFLLAITFTVLETG